MQDHESKVKISVETPGAAQQLKQLQSGADGLKSSLKDVAAGAATTAKALAAVGIAGAAAFGIKAIKDTAQLADEMGKAAQKVGTTTKALSGLKYAADLAGVSFEQLQGGLVKVAKTSEDARDGSKSAQDAFAKIGIDATKYKDTSLLLAAIADQFARMENGARKTAIAQELFGKSGAQLIPMLNGGAAGIHAMSEEAERLGIVITDEVAQQAEQFNDDLSRLGAATDGLKVSFATKLFPALTDIAKAMADAAREGGILNGIWVGLGATMAHILGIDEASKLRKQLEGVNKEIERVQKQLASGSLNPDGASDNFFNFLIPDVKLNDKAKERLRQALENLQKERDSLAASMQPVAAADKGRVDTMVQQSELSAQAKEKESARIKTALESQKQALASAEKAFEEARKKRASDIQEFQNLQKDLAAPAAGTPAQPILGYQVEKAVDDAAKAKDLALTAPTSQANQLAQDALDKARTAGQMLKDYKTQQESTGSSIDANAAQLKVQKLGADLLNIADQATGVQEQIAQQQVQTVQQVIQDTLAQAEALKSITVGFDTDAATQALQTLMNQLRQQLAESPLVVPVKVLPPGATGVTDSKGNMVYRDPPALATGGLMRGPGYDTSDNLLAWLSPGEFVVRAAAVRKYGLDRLAAMNSMRLPKYANGGIVERVSSAKIRTAASTGASGSQLQPINITFPNIGTFPLKAAPDVAEEVRRVLALEALKHGGLG